MTLRRRDLDLLRDIGDATGRVRTMGLPFFYAYLSRSRQHAGVGWDEARMYVTEEVRHTPGLASEVTASARRLIAAGLVELGEAGRRKSERPLVLTDAGRRWLAEHDTAAGG